MDKDEFINLSVGEQNWLIYDAVAKVDGRGIEGLFGPGRPEVKTPVQPKTQTPPGFTGVFGEEPDKSNSAHRAVWLGHLQKFEGEIELRNAFDYGDKLALSQKAGLGRPIAYKYDGRERICFENKPAFFRPLSWYYDVYNLLVDAARNG